MYWWNKLFPKVQYEHSDVQRIWFFLAADYGNLGDVAITLAQTEFLQKAYSSAEVIVIPISQTLKCIGAIQRVVKPKDIITIVGGGNMSDLYADIEFLRRLVIRSFHKNKIISFPQSLYFTYTDTGKLELDKSVKVYSHHPNLTLIARDSVSLKRMKEFFPNNTIKLAPDIVLSLDRRRNFARDMSVVYCLRNDKEQKYVSISEIATLKVFLETQFDDFRYVDTQIDDSLVRKEGGEKHLNVLLDEFSHAGMIVTDRLHGMILAFITNTPALVFDNSTGKIAATYEWIKDCGFIHLVDDSTDYSQLVFVNSYDVTKKSLESLFKQML